MSQGFKWLHIERDTWVANVPGGLLFRYGPSAYGTRPNAAMVFVPCLLQETVIAVLLSNWSLETETNA